MLARVERSRLGPLARRSSGRSSVRARASEAAHAASGLPGRRGRGGSPTSWDVGLSGEPAAVKQCWSYRERQSAKRRMAAWWPSHEGVSALPMGDVLISRLLATITPPESVEQYQQCSRSEAVALGGGGGGGRWWHCPRGQQRPEALRSSSGHHDLQAEHTASNTQASS